MNNPFAQIPSDWETTRLDRVATVNARIGWKALTAAEYQPDGYTFLATPNIKSEKIDFDSVNYISQYRYDESPELKLAVGDVLLVKDGNTLGITNLVQALPQPATVNGSIAVIRPFKMDSRFLRYILASEASQGRINAVKDGMGVPHLFQGDINGFPLPLPPIEEQRRIADFLDAKTTRVSKLTETYRRTREVLYERRQAAIENFVTGANQRDERISRLPWARSLPSHWETVKLTLLARMGSGHTPSRSRPELWTDPTIPWVTTGDVNQVRDDRREDITETRECVSAAGIANSGAELHPAGTVVLSRTASVGFSAVMGLNMATSQDFATWTCGPRLDPYYLLWCLRAMRPDLLGRLATGSTHQTIYVPDLQALRIPVPSVQEQHTIVDKIRENSSRIDQLVDATVRQLNLLAERRQALITAAVTGQIDVTTARSGVW